MTTDKLCSPFKGLYETLSEDKTLLYLERIGVKDADVSEKSLGLLMKCHLESVPFENLDVFHAHSEPSLDINDLFEKIVIKRRGGYCFELNGLFCALLDSLGFKAESRTARIPYGKNFPAPKAHRIIIADTGERKYFCDIGFGGPVPYSPIPLEFGKTFVCDAGRSYRFEEREDGILLETEKDGEYVPLLFFSSKASDPVDFLPLNAFCSRSCHEPFLKKQMMWRLTREGIKYSLNGGLLKITGGERDEEYILDTEDALREALDKYFGVKYDGSLRAWL